MTLSDPGKLQNPLNPVTTELTQLWTLTFKGWSSNTGLPVRKISKKTKGETQELSKFINIIFKTNINPTEYDPDAFQRVRGYLL